MKIIIALGNPGSKYYKTRHNAGFLALDNLNLDWQDKKKFKSIMAKNGDVIYAKPQTYMNNSGQAVMKIMDYYKLLPRKFGCIIKKNSDLSGILTVVHDDIDIELGKIKESIASRSAGHKGVQSIINHLKTKNFRRIRIGIKGEGYTKMPAEKYVLSKFSPPELDIITRVIKNVQINT